MHIVNRGVLNSDGESTLTIMNANYQLNKFLSASAWSSL